VTGLLDKVERACMVIMALLFAEMLAVLFIQVVLRYVFNTGMSWAEELARFSFVWLTMLGAAVAARKGRHIKIDSIINLFPSVLRTLIGCALDVLIVIFLIVLNVYGFKLALLAYGQKSGALTISMFYPYLGFVVGGVLLLVFFIEYKVIEFKNKGMLTAEKGAEGNG